MYFNNAHYRCPHLLRTSSIKCPLQLSIARNQNQSKCGKISREPIFLF